MKPVPKQVAVILFYNPQGEILLQDRREISKWGEEYGFFGGKVEYGETPEQAIERELEEELELRNVQYELFRRYDHTNTTLNVTVNRNVYLSTIPDMNRINCRDGKAEVRTFRNSLELKMLPGFTELLGDIYQYLKSANRTE